MWRLIFLGLIIYLLIVAFKRSAIGRKNKERSSQKDVPVKEQEAENMVQCAACAVHLPRSEAFMVKNDFYCSQAHIPK
jgi:uncharacterized protein